MLWTPLVMGCARFIIYTQPLNVCSRALLILSFPGCWDEMVHGLVPARSDFIMWMTHQSPRAFYLPKYKVSSLLNYVTLQYANYNSRWESFSSAIWRTKTWPRMISRITLANLVELKMRSLWKRTAYQEGKKEKTSLHQYKMQTAVRAAKSIS